MLKAKYKLFTPVLEFYDDGEYVASYVGGPPSLNFANGKYYGLSLSTPDWVKCPVIPRGKAKIACIVDYHYEVVDDEASADKICGTEHGEIYYKGGELEIVAHAETLLNSDSGIIVCNKHVYHVIRHIKNNSLRVANLFENDNLVGSITSNLLGIKTKFKKDLSLSEKVFLTILSGVWKT